MAFSILGFSVPTFWIGLVLILTFAVTLGWLPAGGRGATRVAVRRRMELPDRSTAGGILLLPALNLSLFKFAMMVRLASAGTREMMLTDTVKFARAAGESEGHDPEPPRAAPDRHPDRHRVRPGVRLDARLRRRHRDDLLLARRGQAHHRFHLPCSTGR